MIIKTNKDEFQDFLSDAANFKGNAEAVYFPETEIELVEIIKECNSKNLHVTIAGNGTGLTGARVPQGGVVISTHKLNKILEINKDKQYALVEAGVILKDFQDAVEEMNLFYPPDPTERNCFLGATIATNSSGARTFKYGPTRNFVLGLKVVLPDGDTLTIERDQFIAKNYKLEILTDSERKIELDIPCYSMPKTKHAAGYFAHENMDAIDLFIGSEGTLGIIYSAKLKLLLLPDNIISCVLFFNDEIDAFAFIEKARDLSFKSRLEKHVNEIDARGLEFFNGKALEFLWPDYPNIPHQAKGAVWFEQEITDDNAQLLFDKWTQLIMICKGSLDTAWFAFNKIDYEKFKDFRHSISWRVNEYCASKGVMKVGTDTAVPHDKFREFYAFCVKAVDDENLNYVSYGHVGDSHIHLNMLPENNERYISARAVYKTICHKAVELGGTISAEHGVGKLKRDYLLDMYGEEYIKQMAGLKLQLDPNKILGIGNIFDEKYLNK